jgi:phage/plasmid-associated DNA primase
MRRFVEILRNGSLNVRTRELFAHSPEFLSTIRIPIAFDPEEACPVIDKFIDEVSPTMPFRWLGKFSAIY